MSVICAEHLTKDYGRGRGIFDLNFQIPEGEVFGYLGPNGAGKTTTIRHLLGFLNPDRGSASIGGLDCRRDQKKIQEDLGYLPGEIAFFDEMTGTQYLRFLADMRGMRQNARRDSLLTLFELDPGGRIKRMSKGMKQKLGLVSAFFHDPSTLILDEPTSGLDPLMQGRFIDLILEEKKAGKTILMSSHSFEEVERTCDRVGILRAGRFAALEPIGALTKARQKRYRVTFAGAEEASLFSKESLKIISVSGASVEVAVRDDFAAFTAALARHPVTGLDAVSQSLEDIFLSYYGGESHD